MLCLKIVCQRERKGHGNYAHTSDATMDWWIQWLPWLGPGIVSELCPNTEPQLSAAYLCTLGSRGPSLPPFWAREHRFPSVRIGPSCFPWHPLQDTAISLSWETVDALALNSKTGRGWWDWSITLIPLHPTPLHETNSPSCFLQCKMNRSCG